MLRRVDIGPSDDVVELGPASLAGLFHPVVRARQGVGAGTEVAYLHMHPATMHTQAHPIAAGAFSDSQDHLGLARTSSSSGRRAAAVAADIDAALRIDPSLTLAAENRTQILGMIAERNAQSG
jgi:hypothetical protein